MTPWHTWQILTKRPERILDCLPSDWGDGWKNVWLGVTVENQAAVKRMDILRGIPAHVRFLSVEPLLERVELLGLEDFHWAIFGGESGNENGDFRYRPCELSWIEDGLLQCAVANVPVFVKQLGTYQYHELGLKDRHGGEMDEWPEHLRIREMPVAYAEWLRGQK